MKPGRVYLGFSTDFFIEEADEWRGECWKMIKERSDCTFLFPTKRIERFAQCIPENWADGYENVTVCCIIENQRNAERTSSKMAGSISYRQKICAGRHGWRVSTTNAIRKGVFNHSEKSRYANQSVFYKRRYKRRNRVYAQSRRIQRNSSLICVDF